MTAVCLFITIFKRAQYSRLFFLIFCWLVGGVLFIFLNGNNCETLFLCQLHAIAAVISTLSRDIFMFQTFKLISFHNFSFISVTIILAIHCFVSHGFVRLMREIFCTDRRHRCRHATTDAANASACCPPPELAAEVGHKRRTRCRRCVPVTSSISPFYCFCFCWVAYIFINITTKLNLPNFKIN